MIKYSCGGQGRNVDVECKPMIRLQQAIPMVVGEAKAQCKLKWLDHPDICVIIAIEFHAKKVTEGVCVWRSTKLGTETVQGDHSWPIKTQWIILMLMEIVCTVNPARIEAIKVGKGRVATLPLVSFVSNYGLLHAKDSWYSNLLKGCQMNKNSRSGCQVGSIFNMSGSTLDWMLLWIPITTEEVPTTELP